ncbi:tudor domain-containing protein 7 isoform X3 [Moschus berezovskii]|uniref:tudor domain-containing protein 7 isoform X3 n=1 Tax=Moschus berezovskii TaxID=68408 RepID=UPI002444D640|nr:tudor domain-containing protein 7 isoform X3 [Moschus berezovskii]
MLEADLVSKMLRAVLQSHKNGIALPRLQGEYRSLTGDWIPFKQLGYPTLEAYLRSVPAVVRIETSRSGEITCYAMACTETARIAQLVARQRSSKRKTGRQVNCQMRVKKTMPFFLEGKPKATLRQPGFSSDFSVSKKPNSTLLRNKGNSLGVKSDAEMLPYTLQTTIGNEVFKDVPVQSHVTMSTNNRFSPKTSLPPPFQMHLSRTCTKEMSDNLNQTVEKPNVTPPASYTYKMDEVQNRIKEMLNKHSNGIWISKLPHFYKELYKEELSQGILQQFEHWPHICTVEKPCSGGQDLLLYPAKRKQLLRSELNAEKVPPSPLPAPKQIPPLKGCPAVMPGDFKEKVAELLVKYSSGLWASALPKTFEDMYKVKLPEDALKNLDLLSDVCTIDYISGNPQKAILYAKLPSPADKILKDAEQARGNYNIKSMVEQEYLQIEENIAESTDTFMETVTIPPLIIPSETSPSVLVVELSNTNEVVIRYVGKDYSAAQELMEDEMKEYYSKNSKVTPVRTVQVGQLLAVNAEEDAWLRAQVISMEEGKIKVCYVDYGFSENVEKSKAYRLNPKFCSLSFQATKCKLAGLEVLSDDPDLVKVVESLTCGKIFAVEILEKTDIPLVVLYDTSGEDDININATCLKAICDKSLEVHLQITNVHSSRALDVQFLDAGTVTSVKVSELREIPPRFLQEMISVPPQAIKCCLADLPQSIGMWTPDAVLWLRDSVLNCSDCSIKVTKVDETRGIAHIYLFTPKNFPDPHRSINRQITNADLWKHQKDVFLSAISGGASSPNTKSANTPILGNTGENFRKSLTDVLKKSVVNHPSSFFTKELPPPVHLSKPGEHMDVYVPVACHPGYFVIQPWQEIHKLEVLMEEMILYYSVSEERHVAVEKDQVYAAKVENKWHRVLLKGILTNGLVSVYELDYGKHELVNMRKVQPLADMFRKLPFQAVTAQLAGVKCNQWSEEASMVFRNHVEKKPLVALVQTVIENTNPWDRKVVVYLVDTSLPDTDIWIHDFMSEYLVELSKVN